MDKNSCSVYAVAFTCNVHPDRARWVLSLYGRKLNEGATMAAIKASINELDKTYQPTKTPFKTIRSFAKAKVPGVFLIETADHVLAIVDGYVCDKPENSDLMRIQQVYEIV